VGIRGASKPRSQKERRERAQVNDLLRQAASHFLRECVSRGVGEVVVGDLSGLREGLDYGKVLNQRLHAWPYRKLVEVLRYKGTLMGIKVYEVEERRTSVTCHACGKASPSNRRHRGLYACSCDRKAQADLNGALKVYERAFQVSPVKGSSGRVAQPAVRSFRLGWRGVHEPRRKGSLLCAS
jgi:putative transposase